MIRELCLVLLIDGSGSVPPSLYEEAVRAHVVALRHEPVQAHAEQAGMAVTAFAIGDRPHRLMPWMAGPAEAAAELEAQPAKPWRLNQYTGTGQALAAALEALDTGPACERQVIDLATDGQNTAGPWPEAARGEAERRGVTVNAVNSRRTAPSRR